MKCYIISDDKMVRDAFRRAIKALISDINPEGVSCQNVIYLHLNDIILVVPTLEQVILGRAGSQKTVPEEIPFDLNDIISKITNMLNDPVKNSDKNDFVVIPSQSEKAINSCLMDILKYAYGKDRGNLQGLEEEIKRRYLFIVESGEKKSVYFNSISKVLEDLRLAKKTPWDKSIEKIHEIKTSSNKPVSFRKLREKIEFTCFPSGAEEIQELLFYNKLSKDNEEFGCKGIIEKLFPNEDNSQNHSTSSAIRLLLGAFLAGDLKDIDSLLKTIGEINKRDKLLSDEEVNGLLRNALEKIDKEREKLNLAAENLSPLTEYLKNRHILLIEDKLEEEGWDIALPYLFVGENKIKENARKTKFPSVYISHIKNAEEYLDLFKSEPDDPIIKEISNIDIILLDLYSSYNHSSEANPLSTIPQHIKKLIDKIKSLYDEQKEKCTVATSFPQIVVFSRDIEGVSVRTMLKDLGVSDYFFKDIKTKNKKTKDNKDNPHADLYYASFRNALINALKDNVANILNLPYYQKNSPLNEWLIQFLPCDRPLILRIMKHFRYYSAMDIVKTFDDYLEKPNIECLNFTNNKPEQVWFSYLGRATKSGPSTLPLLSKTEWLKKLKNKFKQRDDLPQFKTYDKLPEAIKENDKKIHIIFVDDMILTGGQIDSYLWKFINEHLREQSGDTSEDTWKIIREKLTKQIKMYVLGAIGIKNEHIEELSKAPEVSNSNSRKRNFKGSIKVRICCQTPGQHHYIDVPLHIADYTFSFNEVCDKEKIEGEDRDFLKKYYFIVNAREKEYPCDFEPFGWKESGGLIATYANTPGNTLPIIWGEGEEGEEEKWTPLFPRFFNPWDKGSESKKECDPDGSKSCKLNEEKKYCKKR